jgi:Ca2+-binding RTX toxin-like protein
MTTFALEGRSIEDSAAGFGSIGTLYVSLPDNTSPIFSYVEAPGQENENFDDEVFPYVDLTMPNGTITLLEGVDIQDEDNFSDIYFAQILWGGSNTTWILNIDYFSSDFSGFNDYLFHLGGPNLPTFTSDDQLDTFVAQQVTGIEEISSGPFRPGNEFNINQIPGITEVDGMVLRGNVNANLMIGGYDDDELTGLGGNDTMNGGAGDDTLRGGKQEDVLNGGNGADKLFGQRNADVLNGNAGKDKLNAGGGNDTLNGGDGDDFLKGGTRDDVMNGGNGNDKLVGNAGRDVMTGGNGNDKLNAGGDNDIMNGGLGNDTMKGGGGSDTFIFRNGHGTDTVEDFDTSSADGDVLDLSAISALGSLEDVTAAANETGGTVEIDTGNGNLIILEDVQLDALSEENFLF